MQRKKIELSKRHNSAFFKYSNQEVFDRREKQFFKNRNKHLKKFNTLYPNASRNHYTNLKQKFFKEKNILQYLKTLQNFNSNDINTNKCYLQTISYYDEMENNTKKTLKKNKKTINKSKSIQRNNPMFNYKFFNLTEGNNIKPKKILYNNNSSKNYYTINYNRIFDTNEEKIKNNNHSKKISGYNYKGIKELLLIKREKEQNDTKNNEDLIKINKMKDYKNMQFQRLRERSKDYIDKMHKFDMVNFSVSVKKERAMRLEDVYNNQIEYYNYAYKNLLNSKKLFDLNFTIKLFEYLKYLSIKIEQEKIENLKLLNEIINYKNEIENINSKIKKIEYEKSNIVRWVYLQIQLKEKKLILPDYYKAVFEFNNINSRKILKSTIKKETIIVKRERTKLSSSKKLTFNLGNNNEINNENNINKIDLNGTKINLEEYQRIKKYKSKLIYSSPENFNEALLNIENNNLKLINYNDSLKEQLFILKKEYNKIKKEQDIIENSINTKIKYRENDLKIIQSIINERMNNGINSKLNYYLDENNKGKKSPLYLKVVNIYENCKLVELDEYSYTERESSKQISVEEEIIKMLTYIEVKTQKIINKVNSYIKGDDKISFEKYIMKLKCKIDKEHKSEKTKMLKNKQIDKFKKLYKKIEERNNKIFILPRKKLDISRLKMNKKKVIEVKKEIKQENNLEDFLDN